MFHFSYATITNTYICAINIQKKEQLCAPF
jgi:hypothetical protein